VTDYELTRRDAIAALATAGITGLGASDLSWEALDARSDGTGPPLTDHHRDLLVAVATVVYPSAVEGIPAFVETYVVGRHTEDAQRFREIADSLDYLDEYSRQWYDDAFLDVAPEDRETVLEAMGADVVDPDPEGDAPFRFRFYVVNELLYALYSSPTGGELLGLENPQGYPGGTDSYQHPPQE